MRRHPFLALACLLIVVALTACATHSVLTKDARLARIDATWSETPAEVDPSAPPLTVVYPRGPWPDTLLAPTDSIIEGSLPPESLFVLGSVADPRGSLVVNGISVPIHPDGGWLAWVPRGPIRLLSPGEEFGPGRISTVTIDYRSPSHEQMQRRILFLDKPEAITGRPPTGFVDQQTQLMVSEENAKIRCGWPGTYDLFPLRGTLLDAVGHTGDARKLWKVPLGDGVVGWIEDIYVTETPDERPLRLDIIPSVVAKVEHNAYGREMTVVEVPLRYRHAYRIQQVAPDQVELTVYGAVSQTDLIIQPFGSKTVDELFWSQVDSTTWKLTAQIDPVWFNGWDSVFADGNDLVWTIFTTPEIEKRPLEGLRIVLDPGHGGVDYSAIGPTGLPEKTANLMLAQALTRELQKSGAEVIPTRTSDETVGLYERVDFARDRQPDLLLSLHHNALGQGINPARHHGASVHYNHRHAHAVAEALYASIRNGGWPVNGLRYQDLALARPTFCPAVLVEAGYMMHPGEEALFRTEAYHEDMASWLRRGLETYYAGVRDRQRDD